MLCRLDGLFYCLYLLHLKRLNSNNYNVNHTVIWRFWQASVFLLFRSLWQGFWDILTKTVSWAVWNKKPLLQCPVSSLRTLIHIQGITFKIKEKKSLNFSYILQNYDNPTVLTIRFQMADRKQWNAHVGESLLSKWRRGICISLECIHFYYPWELYSIDLEV